MCVGCRLCPRLKLSGDAEFGLLSSAASRQRQEKQPIKGQPSSCLHSPQSDRGKLNPEGNQLLCFVLLGLQLPALLTTVSNLRFYRPTFLFLFSSLQPSKLIQSVAFVPARSLKRPPASAVLLPKEKTSVNSSSKQQSPRSPAQSII